MSFAEKYIEKFTAIEDKKIREVFLDAELGIIGADDAGLVTFYNRYESQFSGIAEDEALGKNFFTQIAPCTNNRIFAGRFKDGITKNHLDHQFTYTFTYRMRPTNVQVHLYRDGNKRNWILIQKYNLLITRNTFITALPLY